MACPHEPGVGEGSVESLGRLGPPAARTLWCGTRTRSGMSCTGPPTSAPANALVAVTTLAGPALRVLQRVGFALPPVLASNDTATHAGIRKVVAGFFTPATVAAMEPRIRELAREAARNAAEQLDSSGQVDLVQCVAAFPPAVVMLELLGLPVRDLAALKRWGLDSMELFWGWPDEDRQLELARSAADFYVWLRKLVAESRTAPGRNLFKSLAEHGLSTPEICSLGYFLLIAGQETTTQLISTTLFRLLEGSAPVGWNDAASEAGSRKVVRHVLATESSVPTWRRVAAYDTNLAGGLIPAGTEILLELSGNHITSPAGPESLPARAHLHSRPGTVNPPAMAWCSAPASTAASEPSSQNSRRPSSSRKLPRRFPSQAAGPRGPNGSGSSPSRPQERSW